MKDHEWNNFFLTGVLFFLEAGEMLFCFISIFDLTSLFHCICNMGFHLAPSKGTDNMKVYPVVTDFLDLILTMQHHLNATA